MNTTETTRHTAERHASSLEKQAAHEDHSAADADNHSYAIAQAAAIRSTLSEEAQTSDQQRRLTERSVDAVVGAGMFRLFTPKRYGGFEAKPSVLFDACVELGRGCCSASWVVSVLNMGNYMVGHYPVATQDEVWGEDPDIGIALIISPSRASVERVEGGVIVSGEWGYASGCLHAGWIAALIPKGIAPDDETPNLILMRAEDVEIRDTWHITGMRGTGSNTVVAKELFIPNHRITPYAPIVTGKNPHIAARHPLYSVSFSGLLSLGLLGPQLGAVETALNMVREQSHDRRVTSSTFRSQAQSPAFQTDMAEAAMMIQGARLHARQIVDTVEHHALSGALPDELTRSSFRMESTRATKLCRDAIERILTAYGSAAFMESNPLQRIWRDIHVGSRHAGFGMGIPQLVYGRSLVGLDPREISYLV
ncbi:acyl-CoA dehydrogenase family protein [Chromobacterium sp. IIBBL 290-4]|uniref:acyl-CoA dehydrogenase family protein n=1 Tax=Chromobacterium sp. IIBBL 290-4 TaxID=2953890 RepID=UPI0020B7CCCA|nr:acyl-CoA dehydrogenase family protein [Chromobacterium sp. IIBBL 290-4]UTH76298.1 hypothetical protein NKT35_09425 [Chromobacterium sp. IIBBL 290-4]